MDQGVENTQQPVSQPQQTSEDTKTIVTVLLLIFFFPVGLILMWLWPAWSKKVKVIVTAVGVGLPVLIGLTMMFFFMSVFLGIYKFTEPLSPSNINDLEKRIERLDAREQNSSLACFDTCESSGSSNDPATRVLCIQSCVKQVENDVK